MTASIQIRLHLRPRSGSKLAWVRLGLPRRINTLVKLVLRSGYPLLPSLHIMNESDTPTIFDLINQTEHNIPLKKPKSNLASTNDSQRENERGLKPDRAQRHTFCKF
jgi:hypothetical protein